MKIIRAIVVTVLLCVCTMFNSCNTISDREFEVNGVKFKMIAVEGGSFMMGATPGQGDDARENEKPAHKVTVDDFLIGEIEVTQQLWFAVMGSNPSHFKNKDGNYPVENVSWNDVQEFIKKLNEITGQQFRLPFESEWEYAARGGKKSTDKKYAGSDDIDEVAWYKDNAGGMTHAVASKKANELGIYDMSGNVWEWCEDWYGGYEATELVNSQRTINSSHIVMRGDSWYNGESRVSFRRGYRPDTRGFDRGFRLVMIK